MVNFDSYVADRETDTYKADCGHAFVKGDTVYAMDNKVFCSKDCLLEYIFRGIECDEIEAPSANDTGYFNRHISYVKGDHHNG